MLCFGKLVWWCLPVCRIRWHDKEDSIDILQKSGAFGNMKVKNKDGRPVVVMDDGGEFAPEDLELELVKHLLVYSMKAFRQLIEVIVCAHPGKFLSVSGLLKNDVFF